MITIERTVTIHRPLEDVFAYLTDVEHGPRFISGQRAAHQTSAGPMDVGTTFTTTGTLLRRRRNNTVTAYEPNRRLTWKTTSGAPATTSWDLEPSGPSTRVTFRLITRVPGFLRLAEPMIEQRVGGRVDHDLAALKELLAISRTTAAMGRAW
jgi:uncharacterized membrane protein